MHLALRQPAASGSTIAFIEPVFASIQAGRSTTAATRPSGALRRVTSRTGARAASASSRNWATVAAASAVRSVDRQGLSGWRLPPQAANRPVPPCR